MVEDDKIENYKLENVVNNEEELVKKLEDDYDKTVEFIIDKALELSSKGSFFNVGFYQFISFFLISVVWVSINGWYGYSVVFTGYVPPHKCYINANESDFLKPQDSCQVLNITNNQTYDCDKWTYDDSQMKSTIITEYNLVCDRSYYLEVAYSLEQCGYVFGVFVFSRLADKIGRKPILILILFIISIVGILQYFIKNFYFYVSVSFIMNLFASSIEPITMPLIEEMFQAKKRTMFGIGIGYVWVLVVICLAPLAYFINTWRELRLAVFITLGIYGISSIWLVEESLTWLISTNELDKARVKLEKIVRFNRISKSKNFKTEKEKIFKLFDQLKKFNNRFSFDSNEAVSNKTRERIRKLSENLSELNEKELSGTKSNVCFDIMRHRKFLIYVVIIVFTALSVGMVYDGITLLNAEVGENIFLNWVIMNVVELPAQILNYYLISRWGRRLPCTFFYILGGLSLLLNSLMYLDYLKNIGWLKLLLFISAKLSIGVTFSIQFLHVSEIFPTNMRSFGLGFSVISYKITAVIAPIISLYLTKIIPWLPLMIYSILSILSGISYFYLPETLNRSLPNSIEDVIGWPRQLTKEEKTSVKKMNTNSCFFLKNRATKKN